MLFQTNTGAKLFQFLSQLGTGLRDVVDPGFEERQRTEQMFFQNPELWQRMAEAQTEAERRAADTIADAQIESGEIPNVLAARGFNFEQAKELLGSAPALTPEEEVSRRTAEQRIEQEQPKAKVEAEVAQAGATTAESEEVQEYLNTLDSEKRAMADNMKFEAQRVLQRAERDKAEDYLTFRQEALNGEIPGVSRRDLLLAESNPEMFSGILARERLAVRENLANLKAAGDPQERAAELLKTKNDLRKDINDRVDRIRAIDAGEAPGDRDDLEQEIQFLNQEVADFASVFPREAQQFYGLLVDKLIGESVKFEPAPGFLGSLADRPELLQQGMEALNEARGTPASLSEFLVNPETGELMPGFANFFQQVPGGDRVLPILNGDPANMTRRLANLPNTPATRYLRDLQDNLSRARSEQVREGGREGDDGGSILFETDEQGRRVSKDIWQLLAQGIQAIGDIGPGPQPGVTQPLSPGAAQ